MDNKSRVLLAIKHPELRRLGTRCKGLHGAFIFFLYAALRPQKLAKTAIFGSWRPLVGCGNLPVLLVSLLANSPGDCRIGQFAREASEQYSKELSDARPPAGL